MLHHGGRHGLFWHAQVLGQRAHAVAPLQVVCQRLGALVSPDLFRPGQT
jgi:hypothetical protein